EDIDNLIADPVVFRYGKLDQKVNAEKHRYSDIQRELTEMENSYSYRLGRKLLTGPRIVRALLGK
ncbi:MAG: hypothetical protein ACOYIK_08475, partial [Coriobacteriales bacterium]